MRIAVVNETSAADHNLDIVTALEGRGQIINAGMTISGAKPELTYIHTGFMAALLLNAGRADLVVGGCGTGQGFMNSVLMYPGVICGHILTPLDASIFPRINAGNCISLMLNQGWGWGSDLNLKMIFDAWFGVESGAGYPAHRVESQKQSRERLTAISRIGRRSMAVIVRDIDAAVIDPALNYPGFWEILDVKSLSDRELAAALSARKRGR